MSPREQLLDLLGQKKEQLIKMREITEQCVIMLNDDEVDAFTGFLEEREGIIQKIDAFSRMERQIPPVDEDKPLKAARQQIRDIIQEILQLDEQNTAIAQSKISLYKEQIKNLNQKKNGIGKYMNAGQAGDAYYFDQKK